MTTADQSFEILTLDRGVANKERVALRAKCDLNTDRFALTAGVLVSGQTYPQRDSMFWMGGVDLNENDWIFVYTGGGINRADPINDGKNRLFSLYWGRGTTVFHRPETFAIIMEINSFHCSLPVPPPQPQIQMASPEAAPPRGLASQWKITG